MRLKKVKPDSCANCKSSILVDCRDFCKKFQRDIFNTTEHFSGIYDVTKVICEDGYEDDGSRFLK